MKTEITIVITDQNLRNRPLTIVAVFGAVAFSYEYITICRHGYNKEFLDMSICMEEVTGVFCCNHTKIFAVAALLATRTIKNALAGLKVACHWLHALHEF